MKKRGKEEIKEEKRGKRGQKEENTMKMGRGKKREKSKGVENYLLSSEMEEIKENWGNMERKGDKDDRNN